MPYGYMAEAALEGFSWELKKFPAEMRASTTCGRGTEVTCYAELTDRLDIDIWFADPHAPWQRGLQKMSIAYRVSSCPKVRDSP